MSLNGSLALINQALDINASSAGSASKLVTPTGWQVKDDGSGNLGFYNPASAEKTFFDPSGFLHWTDPNSYKIGPDGSANFGIYTGSSEVVTITDSGTIILDGALELTDGILYVNDVATVGSFGVASVLASTLTTPISIPSGGVTIKSYTPLANGLFLVVVSVMCTTTATITITVTYTDGTSTATATQTPASAAALTANNASTYIALCNATTATAITVTGTASVGTTDLHGSAAIFAL